MRGILDSAMDAIITVDAQQNVVLFNKAAESDVSHDTRGGDRRADRHVHPRALPRDAWRARASGSAPARPHPRRMADARIVTGVRRDGEEFPIDASISQLAMASACSTP